MTPTMPARDPHRPTRHGAEAPPCLRVALVEGRILACNESFAELVGRPVEALVGASLVELLAPTEHDAVLARLDALVHFGRDRIEAIAIDLAGGNRALCAIDGAFAPDADEAVDLILHPLPPSAARRAPAPPASDRPAGTMPDPPAGAASPTLAGAEVGPDAGDGSEPDARPGAGTGSGSGSDPVLVPRAGRASGAGDPTTGAPAEALRVLDHLGKAAVAFDDE